MGRVIDLKKRRQKEFEDFMNKMSSCPTFGAIEIDVIGRQDGIKKIVIPRLEWKKKGKSESKPMGG